MVRLNERQERIHVIIVVDYGMGNVSSVVNMLRKAGTAARAASSPDEVASAARLILPGVGAFDAAMGRLRSTGLADALEHGVMQRGVPVLGICLGMQVLTAGSEEGAMPGLGWIPGRVRRFRFEDESIRVPHMGWNAVRQAAPSPLLEGMYPEPRFYFVHSYHVECDDPGDVILTTQYGYPFASGIGRRNIFGVQFHPEKSHKFGMRLLQQFASIQ
jgi:glutamine amidotransferase